ncbi:MAG: hypothetical protein AAGC58_05365 [Asticcacaulis sp.]
MTHLFPIPSLQNLLRFDALSCALMGVGLIAARVPLEIWTGLPASILLWAGILLLPIAAFMAFAGSKSFVPPWATTVIILGNIGWVIASLLLPIVAALSLTPLGWMLLLGQAGFVTVMAALEYKAARRPLVLA